MFRSSNYTAALAEEKFKDIPQLFKNVDVCEYAIFPHV
jgi:hypothetical protein